jgi:predicted thioesterase
MMLEHAAGTVIGIEVKAGETVRAEDFRGLRARVAASALRDSLARCTYWRQAPHEVIG